MKKFATIKLWSLLVFGFLFLLYGVYLFASGNDYPGTVKAMIIAGMGQLVLFYILLFTWYRKGEKKKD